MRTICREFSAFVLSHNRSTFFPYSSPIWWMHRFVPSVVHGISRWKSVWIFKLFSKKSAQILMWMRKNSPECLVWKGFAQGHPVTQFRHKSVMFRTNLLVLIASIASKITEISSSLKWLRSWSTSENKWSNRHLRERRGSILGNLVIFLYFSAIDHAEFLRIIFIQSRQQKLYFNNYIWAPLPLLLPME